MNSSKNVQYESYEVSALSRKCVFKCAIQLTNKNNVKKIFENSKNILVIFHRKIAQMRFTLKQTIYFKLLVSTIL